MEIHKVGAHIGAEIRGVDPVSMDDASFEKLRQTLLDHHVIFFRGTSLDDEAHLALGLGKQPRGLADRGDIVHFREDEAVDGLAEGSEEIGQPGCGSLAA